MSAFFTSDMGVHVVHCSPLSSSSASPASAAVADPAGGADIGSATSIAGCRARGDRRHRSVLSSRISGTGAAAGLIAPRIGSMSSMTGRGARGDRFMRSVHCGGPRKSDTTSSWQASMAWLLICFSAAPGASGRAARPTDRGDCNTSRQTMKTRFVRCARGNSHVRLVDQVPKHRWRRQCSDRSIR